MAVPDFELSKTRCELISHKTWPATNSQQTLNIFSKRLEATIKDLDSKQDKKREEIMKLQESIQQMQVKA